MASGWAQLASCACDGFGVTELVGEPPMPRVLNAEVAELEIRLHEDHTPSDWEDCQRVCRKPLSTKEARRFSMWVDVVAIDVNGSDA